MKLVYEASNTVEAHMVLNLLEQAGLSSRIDGEYLQGGAGELQAMGVVRVMVEEKGYAEARVIIEKWDLSQPEYEIPGQISKKKSSFGAVIVSFILGVAAMMVYYNTPVTDDGVDYNGDGKLDEQWTYVNYLISKTELDRNFDGEIDYIYEFDRKGLVESYFSDDDFDGVFETEGYFEYGNVVWQKSDTTGDGFNDFRIDFKRGVTQTISFIDPITQKIIKTQEYGPLLLRKAKVDTTGDGVLDTVYEYDSIEEIAKKSKL